LLSISVMNVLRSQSLPNTDFTDPASVMKALNLSFPMEKQNNMFFTLWYGVWNSSTNKLVYSSAGHPPALLISPDREFSELLRTEGIVIGAEQDVVFKNATIDVLPGSQLYVFSDGVYEVTKEDKTMLRLEDMVSIIKEASVNPDKALVNIQRKILSVTSTREVSDDYSILQIIFPV
jgi:sigma-B regulation protein RsbU (phosphoserine phosphatase)